jgi:hypothetical protein
VDYPLSFPKLLGVDQLLDDAVVLDVRVFSVDAPHSRPTVHFQVLAVHVLHLGISSDADLAADEGADAAGPPSKLD